MKNFHKSQKVPARIRHLLTFLLIGFFLGAGETAWAQQQIIRLGKTKLSTAEAFAQIRKQTDFNFFYSNTKLDEKTVLTFEQPAVPLSKILDQAVAGKNLAYKIDGNTIILMPKSTSPALKQKVSGLVTDKQGIPLQGVTVAIQGTSTGTATDPSGHFTIETELYSSLLFSFIGMKPQKIFFSGQRELKIVLEEQVSDIDEVVVTGYQRINRERSTGSFTTVNRKTLDKQLGALSIAEKFQSLIPGVLTDANGNFSIRGKSTINANANPIIVVDGFPIESSIETINPNDVENVTILQDAAAASIWGVRASNGVIVITTKSGKISDRPVVTASATWRVQNMPRISSLNSLGASEFVDYQREILEKGWYNTTNPDNNFGYSPVWEIFSQHEQGALTDAQAKAAYDKLRVNARDRQKDLFYRTAVTQQYDLSVSGGSAKNKYYVSANYQDRNAYSRGDNTKILKINSKNSLSIRDYLTFDLGINLSYDKGNENGVSLRDYLGVFPYMPFTDAQGNYVYDYSVTVSNAKNQTMMDQGYYDWRECLKQELDNNDNSYTDVMGRLNAGLTLRIIPGLSLDSRVQYELRNYDRDRYYNENTYYNRSLMNRYTVLDDDSKAQYGLPRGLIYNRYGFTSRSYTVRNQLTANFLFGERHAIAAILGTEVSSTKTKSANDMFMNWDKNKLTYTPFLSTEQIPMWNGNSGTFTENYPTVAENEDRYFSLYFNGSYTFDNRYSISGSLRLDESNLFGASVRDRKTPLYSVGIAWNVIHEKFFHSNLFSVLKLRFTTGENGNIDKKTSKELIARADRQFRTGETYLSIEYPANPDLKWETTRIHNLGLDFGLWNNRVNGSIEYYNKKSFDLLAFVPGDPSFGFDQIYRNTAQMKNSGLNFFVNATVLKTREVTWDVALHLTYNKNRVTKVYSPSTRAYDFLAGLSGSEVEGKPLDYLYNYRGAPLTPTGEPQIYDHQGNLHGWEEDDLNHKEWLKYCGSITPPVYGGFNTSVNYKGITLGVVLSYKLGHVMRMPTSTLGSFQQLYDDVADRWQKPGDEKNTFVPRIYDSRSAKSERNDFYRYSDKLTESASFLRLDNINLSYDLPQTWFGGYLKAARVFVQASNLGVWAKNSRNIDPDCVSPHHGTLTFQNPPLFTFGINATF